MAESDDDLERLFRLEYAPAAPARTDAWSSPRHSPADVAAETAPAGAAVAAQLARSRELRGGWRWTPEQKRLKLLLKAQRQIGADLDDLTHVGARVLHARRASNSAQPVDHLVIAARGVFVVADILSTSDQPIGWHENGHLSSAGTSMRLFEESMVQLARAGVGAAEHQLGDRWRVPVQVVLVVAGAASFGAGVTRAGATVCAPAILKQVVTGPFTPAIFDATDTTVIADALARSMPDGT